MAAVGYLFFHSGAVAAAAAVVGSVCGILWVRRSDAEKKKLRYRSEFRETLEMLLPVLRSGRSMESAVRVLAKEDMDPSETPWMYERIKEIVNGLDLGYSVENLFLRLGEESGLGDAAEFAEILRVSKRTSGDIVTVLEQAIQVLKEKMEAEEELAVMLAKRKMEQKILNGMPFFILAMLGSLSPDYLTPLYETFQGRAMMVVCLLLIGGGLYLSHRMVRTSL